MITTGRLPKLRRFGGWRLGNAGSTPGTIGTVVQSVATQYDGDSNPVFVTTSQLNADGTTYRTSYVGSWYNNADQLTNTVNYGTNNGTSMSQRPADPPGPFGLGPISNTDPTGLQTTYANDYLGRVSKVTVNSTVTSPSAVQQVTTYGYDGLDRQVSVIVQNVTPAVASPPSRRQFDTTLYIYGVSTGNGSTINSNDLLWKTVYPDGTTQQCAYDALGELITEINRDHSVHTYQYDLLGRQTKDSVSNLPLLMDGSVTALGTTYDTLGDVTLATSYEGSGNIVNQVQNVYDGLGNLVTQYQAHSGAVNTTSAPYTPAVQYEYSTLYEGAGNYSRLTGVTYPGGTQVSYAYAGLDNSISRITSVADAGTTVETSQYLGLSTVVGVTEPNLMETTTLDTFGDTSDIAWSKGGSGLVNVAYGFDAVGDVLCATMLPPTTPEQATSSRPIPTTRCIA